MKKLILLFTAILCISCQQKSQGELITGDWKRADPVEVDGKKSVDRITFTKNGDIKVQIELGDGSKTELKGKYMLANNNLTVIYPENGQHEFEVKKLTENELEVFNKEMNHIAKYER